MPDVPVVILPLEKLGLMSQKKALEFLGIKARSHLDWLVLRGEITAYKFGDTRYGGLRVYSIKELEKYRQTRSRPQQTA